MIRIEIDEELFEFLQKKAKPLVDTPNSVLRRLLLNDEIMEGKYIMQDHKPSQSQVPEGLNDEELEGFLESILRSKFEGRFYRRRPYQMMFESSTQVVYFQNFKKKDAKTLWYRLSSGALKTMHSLGKSGTICFTNPADRCGYLIPLERIDEKVKTLNWKKPEIEVNIDHGNTKWREFSWDIEEYYVEFTEV
jgi:hypothetical protein